MTDQYSGHVTSIDQLEASIQVLACDHIRLLWDQATCVHKVSLIMIFQMFQFVRHVQTLYVIAIFALF